MFMKKILKVTEEFIYLKEAVRSYAAACLIIRSSSLLG